MRFHISIRDTCASFLVLLITVCLLLVLVPTTVSGQLCLENERDALLHFKQAIQFDRDGLISSWGHHTDCCQWHGVRCSNLTRHVISLQLSGGLEGKLSSSLIELKHLKHLVLSYCDFTGEIPQHLSNLSHLTTLDLQYNFLSFKNLGWLSHLTLLREIDLSGNDLSEATDWYQVIANLPFLRRLNMESCELSSTISAASLFHFNSSSDLQVINLRGNNLNETSIFQYIFNLTKISTNFTCLDLSFNTISGLIPSNFGTKMCFLTYLDLKRNQLQGSIPSNIANMHSLTYLRLSYNQFEGPILELISNLKLLTYIDLSYNNLKMAQSVNPLVNLCSLQTLHLNYVNLKDELSKIIHTLSIGCVSKSLVTFDLRNNEVWGSIPDTISTFSSLEALYLKGNQLNGTVSPNIGQLHMLEELELRNNSLEGEFTHHHLSNLSSLFWLDLSNNPTLVVNITTEWVPPFQLDAIHLSSCKLGPDFPKWLFTQTNFYEFDVSNSGISDVLPSPLWNSLPFGLSYFNISINKIYGVLPPLTKVFEFAIVDLSFNCLEGVIPPFLNNVWELYLNNNKFSNSFDLLCPQTKKDLVLCNLSNNLLQGKLPECWTNLDQLHTLQMENNQLYGNIPATIGVLQQLEVLHLGNNNFSGGLPMSLENCIYLIVFDLSYNSLTGPIPPWIGSTAIEIFLLRNNYISGTLPRSLCQLQNLQILDISCNHISGTIPKCIYNFTAMKNATREPLEVVNVVRPSDDPEAGYNFVESASLMWKSQGRKFEQNNLELVKLIALSYNQLQGSIPSGIVSLKGLTSLELAGNNLTGSIPSNIGELSSLEFLDLSNNHLGGEIPTSLSTISYLGVLDLSNNNFSGKIPSGTQLQGFNSSVYEGNPNLCGPPLSNCSEDTTKETNVYLNAKSNDDNMYIGIYISIVLGFIVGFWGVCGTLVLKPYWRYVYFQTLGDFKDRIVRVFRKA